MKGMDRHVSLRVGNAHNGDTLEVNEDGITLYLYRDNCKCDEMVNFTFEQVFDLLIFERKCSLDAAEDRDTEERIGEYHQTGKAGSGL